MPTEKKKVSVKKLLDAEFGKPLVSKRLMEASAYENLVQQQYLKDKEFRKMFIKLRNAFVMRKIGPAQLKEYFRKILKESVDRTAVRWVTVEFYTPKKNGKKKPKKKKAKKK